MNKEKLQRIKEKIWSNKIIFLLLLSTVYALFFDKESFKVYIENEIEIHRLESKIQEYRDAYKKDSEELEKLNVSPAQLEKIAREKYLMKKENEDIYIIE